MSKFADELEKKILVKINLVSSGKITAKDSGVNVLLGRLKGLDEVAAKNLQDKYIAAVKKQLSINKIC